jgi:hypothetical protein
MITLNRLSGRPFVSLLTTFSFIIATISGIVLYVSPQGRIAFWQNWTVLGIDKAEWSSLHTLACFLFATTSLVHLAFNWRSLLRYLRSRVGESLGYRRELGGAITVTVLFVVSALYGLPPLNGVVTFGEQIKASWAKGADNEPPFPHAELLTLKGLTTRQGIDTGAAMNCLQRQGINVRTDIYALIRNLPVMTVQRAVPALAVEDQYRPVIDRIATTISPRTAHAASAVPTPPTPAPAVVHEVGPYTEDSVVIKFEGTGVGKKTLEQVCREFNVPLATAQRKLAAKGLTVSPTETFKEAAKRAGVVPIEILQAVLVGEPALK